MPRSVPPTFAEWLNAAMTTRDLSPAELARLVHVADTQVSRWRHGIVVPRERHLERLAQTFGVPRARLERLAGYPANPLADSQQDDPPGSDPVLDALLDQERSEVHEDLHDIPPVFWQTILQASRAARQAAVNIARQVVPHMAAGSLSTPAAGDISAVPEPEATLKERRSKRRAAGISRYFVLPPVAFQTANA